MAIRVVQLGSKREAGEGLRIGTVRRPPRGVPKAEFASRDYYDVWLPTLSPTPALMAEAKSAASDADWTRFVRGFRAQMSEGDPAKVLDLLAALSKNSDFSIGCYCDDENRCHRSVLRQLLDARGAHLR